MNNKLNKLNTNIFRDTNLTLNFLTNQDHLSHPQVRSLSEVSNKVLAYNLLSKNFVNFSHSS